MNSETTDLVDRLSGCVHRLKGDETTYRAAQKADNRTTIEALRHNLQVMSVNNSLLSEIATALEDIG